MRPFHIRFHFTQSKFHGDRAPNPVGSDRSEALDDHVEAGKVIKVLKLGQRQTCLAGKRIGDSDLIIVDFENSDEVTRSAPSDTHEGGLSYLRRERGDNTPQIKSRAPPMARRR